MPCPSSPRGDDRLHNYNWPGNVRQLIKVLKRSMYMNTKIAAAVEEESRLGLLELEVEPADPNAFLPKTIDEIRPLAEARNAYARHALSLYHGNVHATARALRITDRTLLARLGAKPAKKGDRPGQKGWRRGSCTGLTGAVMCGRYRTADVGSAHMSIPLENRRRHTTSIRASSTASTGLIHPSSRGVRYAGFRSQPPKSRRLWSR